MGEAEGVGERMGRSTPRPAPATQSNVSRVVLCTRSRSRARLLEKSDHRDRQISCTYVNLILIFEREGGEGGEDIWPGTAEHNRAQPTRWA